MVQTEYDEATPLAGAQSMLSAYANSRLIVATNMQGHGVFSLSRTPCIERGVADFLTRGVLPDQRETRCVFEPERGAPHDASPHPLREEFGGRLTLW